MKFNIFTACWLLELFAKNAFFGHLEIFCLDMIQISSSLLKNAIATWQYACTEIKILKHLNQKVTCILTLFIFLLFFAFPFLLFLSFCHSDWLSTGLAEPVQEFPRKHHPDRQFLPQSIVENNFALSLSIKFLSIFVLISGSINPITLIWISLERSLPPAELEYKWCQFWSKVMTSEVEQRTVDTADCGRHSR